MISDDFAKGWAFFSNNASATLGAELSATWADDIYSQYQVIEERITEVCKQRAAQNPSIAQGFLAEMWHTETFNLNALIRGSGSVAEMLEETYLGSSDISCSTRSFSRPRIKSVVPSAARSLLQSRTASNTARTAGNALPVDRQPSA